MLAAVLAVVASVANVVCCPMPAANLALLNAARPFLLAAHSPALVLLACIVLAFVVLACIVLDFVGKSCFCFGSRVLELLAFCQSVVASVLSWLQAPFALLQDKWESPAAHFFVFVDTTVSQHPHLPLVLYQSHSVGLVASPAQRPHVRVGPTWSHPQWPTPSSARARQHPKPRSSPEADMARLNPSS